MSVLVCASVISRHYSHPFFSNLSTKGLASASTLLGAAMKYMCSCFSLILSMYSSRLVSSESSLLDWNLQ